MLTPPLSGLGWNLMLSILCIGFPFNFHMNVGKGGGTVFFFFAPEVPIKIHNRPEGPGINIGGTPAAIFILCKTPPPPTNNTNTRTHDPYRNTACIHRPGKGGR